MNSRRSASVGALPREKVHYTSRNESASGVSLDVRCACQFFESDSLLPERINPLDSRPSSKLGFHADMAEQQVENLYGFPQMNFSQMDAGLHFDNLSHQSFNVDAAANRFAADQHSVRSFAQQQMTTVDLSFVEKDPVLEQTARSRGLIVKNISDERDPSVAGSNRFLAGHRRRQMSETSLGMRDPETMSVRSVTSLRRISCSSSKKDLYVADLNIPNARKAEPFSSQTSRRSSNADLSHLNMGISHQNAPQFNLIAPTPSIAAANVRPDFQRAQRSASPAASTQREEDYRYAKPPVSTDYMRPDNRQADFSKTQGGYLPQNRPIDNSLYGGGIVNKQVENNFGNNKMSMENTLPITTPADELEKTVRELEQLAAAGRKIKQIQDDIRAETQKPPSVAGDVHPPSLHPEEETAIEIVSSIPVVDIDMLLSEATAKAEAKRMRSKSPSPRPFGTSANMDSLQLPSRNSNNQQNLKRSHSPDRSSAKLPASSREATPAMESETKGYGSRFMSMFSSKPKSNAQIVSPEFRTENDLNQFQSGSSPTFQLTEPYMPSRENSRSPSLGRSLLSQFNKSKNSANLEVRNINRDRSPTPNRTLTPQNINANRERSASPGRNLMGGKTQLESLKAEEKREKSPSPAKGFMSRISNRKSQLDSLKAEEQREKSPSPAKGLMSRLSNRKQEDNNLKVEVKKERSPSPGRSLISRFTKQKQKPEAIEIMSGSSAVVSKKPTAELMSVKVTETFSLKVDDMDQYACRPAKPPPLSQLRSESSHSNYSRGSHEMSASQQQDITQAFVPVISNQSVPSSFMAGNRPLYASEIDTVSRRSDLEFSSKEPSMGRGGSQQQLSLNMPKGALISVPINLSDTNLPPAGVISFRGSSQQISPAYSDRKLSAPKGLTRKSSFREGRTQSHDRTHFSGSQEDLFSSRMSKTVSFNFDERKSRLGQFESNTLSEKQREKKEFLDRTYFNR